ncbi:uncharacterized protein LOC124437776 [Xenia sp. Carnegie-2017]|uniref:uncharacterized protein LOC124437776 n=1 Tax=Xenia sp. Carnegie-2017 TaxID=2897299 RepID=UPI001F035E42|nr:uncharacterized protein LOC124437776 [Xenia sp. Carnegie-2017]
MGSSPSKPVLKEEEEELLRNAKEEIERNQVHDLHSFYKEQVSKWETFDLYFAIIGSNNLGKSSFINAIRGIEADEREAAPNDESDLETIYPHPQYENIKLCDLPGIGAPNNPDLETYTNNIGGLKTYDGFIIFSKSKFTNYEINLVEKVSKELQRPFVCVHTHAHLNVTNAKEGEALASQSTEATALDKIRECCFDNLKGLVKDANDVYVINNNDTEKYDFDSLRDNVILKLLKRRKEYFLYSLNCVIYGSRELSELEKRLEEAKFHVNKYGLIDVDDFYQTQIDSWRNMKINIAVTGYTGTGKSSFINAVRGLKAYQKDAAPVNVIESKTGPTEYSHPENRNIKLWDLPGIGTPTYPNIDEYCKIEGGLKKYDAFLIFCKSRFTQHDKELAEYVSKELDKPFFFIRTNVDTELKNAKDDEGPKFDDEPSVLRKMKEDCWKNLKGLIHAEKNIYMIDNKVPDKYDFKLLLGNVLSELLERRSERFFKSLCYVIYKNSSMTKDGWCFTQTWNYINHHGTVDIEDFYKSEIRSLKDEEINLAITGDVEARKSSFIYEVIGITPNEKESAPAGVTESTSVYNKYVHPKNENIIFWDLPGIGTPSYPNLQKYCKKVGDLEKYDAFFILCNTRFTKHDKELAEKVSSEFNKPFFFIRTNVNCDVKNTKEDKGENVDEDSVLERMKKDCLENLKGLTDDKNDIYLIDNNAPCKYDFQRLTESFPSNLPERKKECFKLFSINKTREIIEEKANSLKGQAVRLALASAFKNAVASLFGKDFNFDVIVKEIKMYCSVFGFPEEGSEKFKALKKEWSDVLLKYNIETVEDVKKKIGIDPVDAGLKKYIPVFGLLYLAASWFIKIYDFLLNCMNDMEIVAVDILNTNYGSSNDLQEQDLVD